MSHRNTSKEAYSTSYPKHGTNRHKVLKTIEIMGNCTDFQISKILGLSINRITPRRFELLESGLIEIHREGVDPLTNTKANYWKIKYGKTESD